MVGALSPDFASSAGRALGDGPASASRVLCRYTIIVNGCNYIITMIAIRLYLMTLELD